MDPTEPDVSLHDHLCDLAEVMGATAASARRRVDIDCDDAVCVVRGRGLTALAIGDGSTGSGFGRQASLAVVKAVAENPPTSADEAADLLVSVDVDLAAGGAPEGATASAVIVCVLGGRAFGASAGDCEAWALPRDRSAPFELTAMQNRRPRVGDTVVPVGFEAPEGFEGVVLVGSDGFWVNVSRAEALGRAASSLRPQAIVRDLMAHVFNRKGGLADDLAIAAVSVRT